MSMTTQDAIQNWMEQPENVFSDAASGVESLAIDYNYFAETAQQDEGSEVASEGRQLYLEFLRREMREQELDEAPLNYFGHGNLDPRILATNEDLGHLLDQFSKSEERLQVRQKAEEVQLEGISYAGFSGLLSSLFQGGITYERVLVLFCFCSDVCLRALRETAASYFHLITNFSLRFITSTVCVWVQARGGWGEVVRTLKQGCGSYGMAAIGCLAVLAIGAALWHKSQN